MSNNFLLPPLIVGAAYAWYRAGFPRPALWRRMGWSPEATLLFAGSVIIGLLVVYSLGDLWLGAVQVSREATDYYVHRAEDPVRYWKQLALQLTLGLLTGGALIGIGRRARSATTPPATESSRHPA